MKFANASVDDILAQNNGVAPGFNLFRLLLSSLIFYAHCRYALSFHSDLPHQNLVAPDVLTVPVTNLRRFAYLTFVPMFFALSGFLVTGSLYRCKSVWQFLSLRAIRIFPALSVEVILSAIVIGPIFTTVALGEYFSDLDFISYFGNIIGFVQFDLPGVFLENPASGLVNVNLWTLPAEFYCYLLTAILFVVGIFRMPKLFLAVFLTITTISIVLSQYGFLLRTGSVYPTHTVVYYFFCGSIFYIFRKHIPVSALLFMISAIVVILTIQIPNLIYVMPMFLTYIVVFIGSLSIFDIKFLRSRDYSYGIYLYGFPITQVFVNLYPGIDRLSLFAMAGCVTLMFAVLSWTLIERPALRLRKRLV